MKGDRPGLQFMGDMVFDSCLYNGIVKKVISSVAVSFGAVLSICVFI